MTRTFLIVVVLLLLVPRVASAQDTFCAQAASCTTAVSSTSATTIVGIGVTMLSRIRERKVAMVGLYVQMNEVAIHAAIARGAGEVLNDLAELTGVPELEFADFVARLRRQRRTLRVAIAEMAPPRYLGALVLQAARE